VVSVYIPAGGRSCLDVLMPQRLPAATQLASRFPVKPASAGTFADAVRDVCR
jgi:hypothetical protein